MAKSADAFRTISEVAEWLDTPAHVLRFWESRFSQVKPVKRAGGRRYYRPNDMLLLGGIKKLLHEDGMTIKGAQKLLRTDGIKKVSALSQPLDNDDSAAIDMKPVKKVAEETVKDSEPVAEPGSPPLSIVPAKEPETEIAPEPEAEAAPEQILAATSEPEQHPDHEPQPATADTTKTTAGDQPDEPSDNAPNQQLSAIYSRLSALHDRMKANIDPKRQG